jgi:type I site-specific restriction endonuclease
MNQPSITSANFGFLTKHDVQLVRLGALAERYFGDDPNTALIKLRQFGELLAQLTAAKAGLFTSPDEQQSDLLRRLKFERVVPAEVADLFHQVRVVGNKATHAHGGDHAQALTTLKGLLEIDAEAAQADLKARAIEFAFPLRPYQKRAIEAVETQLATGRRAMLLAMATGTGKTKLAIALLYRVLAAKRFRRVCFVVDRSALGTQAAGEFATTRIVSAKTFGDIFGLKGLGTAKPDPETKVHICTIQGLVKRVLYTEDASEAPPVDQYDLMVVDECHRGYLLDREMSDAELGFRSQDDYVSKYRRVLEYFDAVKVGLTATPALHTVDIFGDPIFTYSYREAVIDDFLVDHDPPLQITTALSQAGIAFKKGEQVELIDTKTGAIDLAHLPDDIQFEVENFNKKVVTVAFDRTVADELARHIDPNLAGKTLIFAVNDAHADIIVEQVKKAFREAYGEIEDAAVRKITGSVDRVGDLIRSFRNDTLPKIAVTVHLRPRTCPIRTPSLPSSASPVAISACSGGCCRRSNAFSASTSCKRSPQPSSRLRGKAS